MDSTAPIRSELGRFAGTVRSGMERRAALKNKGQEMRYAHELGRIGLDQQNRQLGMAEETHGLQTKLSKIKLREAEREQEYLDELIEVGVDVPKFGETFGQIPTGKLMQSAPDDSKIRPDGKGITKIPRWKLFKNLEAMGDKLKGAEKVQDKKGQWVFVFPDGRTVETAIYSHLKQGGLSFKQQKELAGIKGSKDSSLKMSKDFKKTWWPENIDELPHTTNARGIASQIYSTATSSDERRFIIDSVLPVFMERINSYGAGGIKDPVTGKVRAITNKDIRDDFMRILKARVKPATPLDTKAGVTPGEKKQVRQELGKLKKKLAIDTKRAKKKELAGRFSSKTAGERQREATRKEWIEEHPEEVEAGTAADRERTRQLFSPVVWPMQKAGSALGKLGQRLGTINPPTQETIARYPKRSLTGR